MAFEFISGWVRTDLRPPIPKDTRRTVLKRAGGYCEECGGYHQLELHHLHYETPFGEERRDDLQALCRDCHKHRHIDMNGEWWNDPVEMEQHWRSME